MGGAKSRNKGINFERYVARRVVPCHSPYSFWRRTKAGERQHHGDVIPTTEDGEILSLKYYVECRRKATISDTDVNNWLDEVRLKAGRKKWILVYKQDRSPIYITGEDVSGGVVRGTGKRSSKTEDVPIYIARKTKE